MKVPVSKLTTEFLFLVTKIPWKE